jgi:elongation factor P--(R)-beta-lysine ligase
LSSTPIRQLIQARQTLHRCIRDYFTAHNVLEVETPVLASSGTTDPAIESFVCASERSPLWLRTSPEFCHKRLLAAGSGDIFEIAKVFRKDEISRRHALEFTMLEYYRIGFDEFRLMADLSALIQQVCRAFGQAAPSVVQQSYRDWFWQELQLDPITESLANLQDRVAQLGVIGQHRRDDCLDLLRTHSLEAKLAPQVLHFVYDFPASQAALAKLNADGLTARRFELFFGGFELANGYFELTDAKEQQRRFEHDQQTRASRAQAPVNFDRELIDALAHGLPSCAGVALGLDRLLMILLEKSDIAELALLR